MAKDDDLQLSTLSKEQRKTLQKLATEDEQNATLGVLNMVFTAIVAVRFPAYYWMWHVSRTTFYLPTRYIEFRKKKWQLYLLDWCYVVTYLSLLCSGLAFLRVTFGISTVLQDYNTRLIRAGFAMASGPLAMSIFAFRNSVIFHDKNFNTSVFIHLSPAMLFWCLRWASGRPSRVHEAFPDMFHVCEKDFDYTETDACFDTWQGFLWCSACPAPFVDFLGPPMILYLCVWFIPYFTIVLVWWGDWCEETGHDTLYKCIWRMQPALMARLEKACTPLMGEKHAGKLGYMLLHLTCMLSFCALGFVYWHSFLLHTLLLTLCFTKAVHNGSSYMFRVFAYRYAAEALEEHKEKLQ